MFGRPSALVDYPIDQVKMAFHDAELPAVADTANSPVCPPLEQFLDDVLWSEVAPVLTIGGEAERCEV